ncbi:hypothetical protein [Lacinutrix mariniflava]|uniref:hypothetical protein n=1 Tax=Lacinutrix mariniflava TaxID=342955 RepID=UPI0006E14AE6|nr:hypothetical protein [Lacinutrix mariniflava]
MRVLLVIILFYSLLSCKEKAEKKLETKKIDTLLYSYKHHHGFMKLILFSDKKFKFINQVHQELGISETTGTYIHENNVLNLQPLLCKECEFNEVNEIYKLVCDTIEFSCLKLQVKTNYFTFNWKNNDYLLSEESDQIQEVGKNQNDFNRFINNYNEGYEPTDHGRYLISKTNKIINKELPIDSFPEKYRNLFLTK